MTEPISRLSKSFIILSINLATYRGMNTLNLLNAFLMHCLFAVDNVATKSNLDNRGRLNTRFDNQIEGN